MKPYLLVLAAFVFISSILWVPDVYAQFGGGMSGGMGGTSGGRRGAGEHSKGCATGEKPDSNNAPAGPAVPMNREQLQYHLGTLQVDLHLSPEQAAVWQTFADRVLAMEDDRSRQRMRGNSAATPVPSATGGIKTIANAVDTARNRLTALEDIESASRALYQTLQPEQKTIADLRTAAFMPPLLRG